VNIRQGSIVVILHNGSARFFADLFAVWSLGAVKPAQLAARQRGGSSCHIGPTLFDVE
jgi:hypothetical protein